MSSDFKIFESLCHKLGIEPRNAQFDEEDHLIELDLSECNLTELPPAIGKLIHLQMLDLSGNQLQQLPFEMERLQNLQHLFLGKWEYREGKRIKLGNQFQKLPIVICQLSNLQKLYLDNNQLSTLPPQFSQLYNLQELSLINNKLKELPPQFVQLSNLQKLYLDNNQLSTLPPQFGQLYNLQELSLINNKLKELPPQFVQLSNLQKLYLYNNRLSALPLQFGQLHNLKFLHLGKNRLSILPPQFDQLRNLQELYLHNNQLSILPPQFNQLYNLQLLYLNNNQLSTLPPQFGQLHNLQYLSLVNNELKKLPPQFGQLHHLQLLYLHNNQLSALPSQFGQLDQLQELSLHNNQLRELPPQFGQLHKLQYLYLQNNKLNSLPPQFGQLSNLQELYLQNDKLNSLPPQFGQLSNLQELYLQNNQLSALPSQFGQLDNLQKLSLRNNRLNALPPQFGRLSNLQELYLQNNQLRELPPQFGQLGNLQKLYLQNNQLRELPPQFGQLRNLQKLYLYNNKLSSLPPQFGQLGNLQKLSLQNNQLRELPPQFGQLGNLQILYLRNNQLKSLPLQLSYLDNLEVLSLDNNQLRELPPQFGQLGHLEVLSLQNNQLKELPSKFGQLSNLKELYLQNNQLRELPPQFGQLDNLLVLYLQNNQLSALPPQFGQLNNLQVLYLQNNPQLRTPPPEIAAQGREEILEFLRELEEGSVIRYEAKLLLLGEGRAGKTSLIRALEGKKFKSDLIPTHGIEVHTHKLDHPHQPDQTLILHIWDFGGQHIYQSTHQFFLTKRSVYLVVWNAGLDVDQAGIDKWLQNIQVTAPQTPILLVATYADEGRPNLNYPALKKRFPQLVGSYSVSNKTGKGIKELKQTLEKMAADLPLMEQEWPQSWVAAEEYLHNLSKHHIDLACYLECAETAGVKKEIARTTLGGYLHDLGKILYFQDDDLLSDLVVLKPNWITKAISRVLNDKQIEDDRAGILDHADLPRIWQKKDKKEILYERRLYPIFLRLMERFDLSYQIEAERPDEKNSQSLIPLLLPYQPPENLPSWPDRPEKGQMQVEMVYRLDFVPPGPMSWFIVRTHRYTTHQHWREGVVLAYKEHQARVELNPLAREIRLLVWGKQPHNFFIILKETLDLILDRFEGLGITRKVPCICHWKQESEEACPRFFRYEDLERRMAKKRYKIECNESLEKVSVQTLLYGIHPSTEPDVIVRMNNMKQELLADHQQILTKQEEQFELLERLQQQSELIVRSFTRQWNWEMKKLEVECPNTFILMPENRSRFNPKNWLSDTYRLHLMCQHPPEPHIVGEGYILQQPEKWWATVGPWLGYLLKFLKYGIPLNQMFDVTGLAEDVIEQIETGVDILEQINDDLPAPDDLDSLGRLPHDHDDLSQAEWESRMVGPALRAFHAFLKEVDPACTWGGLYKTITPDGNILWLCEEHRQPYLSRPLVLPDEE